MHPFVHKWVMNVPESVEELDHRESVRAFLKGFVTGEDFDDNVLLKPLMPPHDCLYALRITFSPQFRIVGGFTRPGEFVATAHRGRKEIGEDWVPVLRRAKDLWGSTMQGLARSGRDRSELLVDFPR